MRTFLQMITCKNKEKKMKTENHCFAAPDSQQGMLCFQALGSAACNTIQQVCTVLPDNANVCFFCWEYTLMCLFLPPSCLNFLFLNGFGWEKQTSNHELCFPLKILNGNILTIVASFASPFSFSSRIKYLWSLALEGREEQIRLHYWPWSSLAEFCLYTALIAHMCLSPRISPPSSKQLSSLDLEEQALCLVYQDRETWFIHTIFRNQIRFLIVIICSKLPRSQSWIVIFWMISYKSKLGS